MPESQLQISLQTSSLTIQTTCTVEQHEQKYLTSRSPINESSFYSLLLPIRNTADPHAALFTNLKAGVFNLPIRDVF